MNEYGYIVIVALVVVGIVGLMEGVRYYSNPVRRLRHQYFRSVGLSRAEAEQSLARRMDRLQERYPGKSEAWYLHYILAELQRDRR